MANYIVVEDMLLPELSSASSWLFSIKITWEHANLMEDDDTWRCGHDSFALSLLRVS